LANKSASLIKQYIEVGFVGWLAMHLKEWFGTGVFEEDTEWQFMWN